MFKKSIFISLIFILVSLIFTCCMIDNDDGDSGYNIIGYKIYVAGNYFHDNGEETLSRGTTWTIDINNSITEEFLADENQYSYTDSIVYNNGDIYIAGYQRNESGINVSKYWKNGQSVELSDGTENYRARSIFIYNDDIYVVGYNTDNYEACYWKNGLEITLTNDYESTADAICVDNNNVYVGGKENKDSVWKAIYWKNGQKRLLANEYYYSFVNNVIVYNNDVYMVGSYNKIKYGKYFAVYWKNGMVYELSDGSYNTRAMFMSICEGSIYVVGDNLDDHSIIYWKNSIEKKLDDESLQVSANSISVVNDVIFVVGEAKNSNGKYFATLWKDDGKVIRKKRLSNIENSKARGVVVLPVYENN